ncbi:MAG: isopenicillin N synthase family dioxygenase [Qingshengfaniella sp.]
MIIYTPPETITDIPVIDLSGLSAQSPETRRHVGWDMHKACRETGFFYVSGHGVSQALIDAQLAWTERFFDLPEDRKAAVAYERGKAAYGFEPMLAQQLDEGSAPDLKESYMFGLPLGGRATADFGANKWPEGFDGFEAHQRAYHAAIGDLGLRIMRGIALSLDLDEHWFDAFFENTVFSVRLLHYPPQSVIAAGNQMGAGAHTDWGGITILLQDDKGGLEVQTAAGTWIRATPQAGCFVVNLGDLLRRWSNDVYKSTLHRVLNNVSGQDRYSVPAFFGPRDDAVIECIASCCQDRPRLYPPITARAHTQDMIRRTYGG